MARRPAQGQNQSKDSLIPSEVASYPFNPAVSDALVRPDPNKSDNLRTNGDYDEYAICSLFHDKNYLAVRTIDSSHKYLPSVTD